MYRRWTRPRRAAWLLLAALLLAACGGNGSPTQTTAPVNATSPPAPTTQAAPASPSGGATRATTALAAPGTPARAPTATRAGTAASPARAASPAAAAAPVAFRPGPWQPGERTAYTIEAKDTGQRVGQATYAIGRDSAADSISASITVGATQDRFQLGFDSATLRPLSEVRSIAGSQGNTDIRAEFHEGGATIETTARGQTQVARINLPPTYYANDQFLVLLRALPFAEGYRGRLTVVLPQGEPPTTEAVVTVTGQEAVATPLGSIQCWRVEARFDGGEPQLLWYAVDAPHYLVKYDTRRFVWLLSQRP